MQAVIYSMIRVPIMGYMGYKYTIDRNNDENDKNSNLIIGLYWALYSLGIYWSSKLWRNFYTQYIQNTKKIL